MRFLPVLGFVAVALLVMAIVVILLRPEPKTTPRPHQASGLCWYFDFDTEEVRVSDAACGAFGGVSSLKYNECMQEPKCLRSMVLSNP